jgi:pimeloyl-ACP methyl ester carboxylesterase
MIKILLAVIMILFGGCSMKQPNTLQSRLKSPKIVPLKLHALIKGEGEPLVMLHGFSSSHESFSHLIEPLSKKYKVYALDLKGFGASPKPRDDRYSVYDQMVLVKQFMDEHNITNPIMIGHSLGGGVILSLAVSGVPIKKMVLLDTAAYRQKRPFLLNLMQIPVFGSLGFYLLPSHYEIMEGYKFAFYDDSKIPQKNVDILTKNLQKKNAKYAFIRANDAIIPDDIDEVVKKYKDIDIPTLILWGYNDIVIRRSKAYKLHHDIQNSKLILIPGCGHLPQEERPKETLSYILDFLNH